MFHVFTYSLLQRVKDDDIDEVGKDGENIDPIEQVFHKITLVWTAEETDEQLNSEPGNIENLHYE